VKAAVFVGVNEPVSVEEVSPIAPGPREVIVRIGASGVCHSDLSLVNGTLPFPPPAILGHEGAGTIEAIGTDVTMVKVGDRVVSSIVSSCGECWYCTHDVPYVCGNTMEIQGQVHAHRGDGSSLTCIGGLGTMAEAMTVDERLVIPVRTDLPDDQLALIGCGITTGVGAALVTANVQPGSTVAVVGCGGVGQSVIQGARIAGAERIIAIDPIELKRKSAESMGATDTIDPTSGDTVEIVRSLTGGRGVDYGFEVVGSPDTVRLTVDLVRSAGKAIIVGVMKYTESIELNGLGFIYGAKSVIGSYSGSAQPRRDFPRYIELAEQGELNLSNMVSSRFSLDAVNDAFEATAAGEVLRSVLV